MSRASSLALVFTLSLLPAERLLAGEPRAADLLAAEKQLATVSQQHVAIARAQLNAAFTVLKGALAAFEADDEPSGHSLAAALVEFQAAVADALFEALQDTDEVADGLLVQLGGPGSAYPAGFYAGHGALADRTRESLEKVTDALYRKTRKRLRRTVKKAAQADLLLNVVVDPPPMPAFTPNNAGPTLVGTGRPLSIDVLVGWRLPGEEEGLLVAGGNANAASGELTVSRTNAEDAFLDTAVIQDERWFKFIPSPASNQIVHVRQGDGSWVGRTLGMR